MPNSIAPSLLIRTEAASKFYINTASQFETNGFLKAIDLYGAAPGLVNVFVCIYLCSIL